jgi:hypothetical protein
MLEEKVWGLRLPAWPGVSLVSPIILREGVRRLRLLVLCPSFEAMHGAGKAWNVSERGIDFTKWRNLRRQPEKGEICVQIILYA